MVSIRGKRRRTSPAAVDDGAVELRHEDLLRLIRMIGEVEDESEKSDASSTMEHTFIMIKPDGVQRGLIGEIIKIFEQKSFILKRLKLTRVDHSFSERFYSDLPTKPFTSRLIEHIISGPVVAMVWEGEDVVASGRRIIGTTNPTESDIGSVRGEFAIDLGRNVVHGSNSVQRESDASSTMEQTFVMIKPDGVQRGLVGEIIKKFEQKSFILKCLKLTRVDRSFAERFYSDLSTKPFTSGLIEHIISGPVVAMVWEGEDVVASGRRIIGATNPTESDIGSVRGDFAIDLGRNVVHGSDSVQRAVKEIALWFPE